MGARRWGRGAGKPVAPLPNVPATGSAEKLAAEHGIDLRRLTGTGKSGVITASDVRRYLAAQ